MTRSRPLRSHRSSSDHSCCRRHGRRGFSRRGFSRGLTLIELLVGLLLLLFLLMVGVPSFQWIALQDRITNATNDLVTALQLARSEAIKLGKPVTICSSANQSDCDLTAPFWTRGWVLFRATDGGGREIIRIGAPMHPSLSVNTRTSRINFESTGSTVQSARFEVDIRRIEQPRCIRVLPSGFVASERMACN